jgi:DNA-binding CsgD family transcriptional regulator
MSMHRSAEQVRLDIIRLCHAGYDPLTLLDEAFSRLRRAVPLDIWFCATMDPATLLYTGALRRGFPAGTEQMTPMLMHNEFMQDDVNKFVSFARGNGPPAGTLYTATGGVPERSVRYRDIFAPMGLGDELRGALRAGGSAWGGFCLHRELSPNGFSEEETAFLQQLAPHLGEGIRAGLALGNVERSEPGMGPGLAILSDALTLLAVTPAAEAWLAEMGDWPRTGELQETLLSLAVSLQALERSGADAPGAMPRTRVRTRRGRWLTLHASRLAGGDAAGQIAIIFELARPAEVAPLLLAAYALTVRETEVAQLVLQGWATEAIADELCISALTVQQHLKAVFEKAGVRSRRELVAQVFHQQYAPRLEAGERPGAGGSFHWEQRLSR